MKLLLLLYKCCTYHMKLLLLLLLWLLLLLLLAAAAFPQREATLRTPKMPLRVADVSFSPPPRVS